MDNLFQRTTDRLAYLPIWLALPAFVLVLIVWVISVPVRYWSPALSLDEFSIDVCDHTWDCGDIENVRCRKCGAPRINPRPL